MSFVSKATLSPGSPTQPSLNFSDSVNTGLYESSPGVFSIAANGVSMMQVGSNVSVQSQLNMNNNKIIGLAAPTLSTDAATKTYVDTAPVNLSSASGVLGVANGGTGLSSATSGSLLLGNGSSALTVSPVSCDSNNSLVLAGGIRYNSRSIAPSANASILASDFLLLVNNSASVSLNLPSASANPGREYVIVKTSSNILTTLTILPNGTDTMNGGGILSIVLSVQFGKTHLISDGISSWYTL